MFLQTFSKICCPVLIADDIAKDPDVIWTDFLKNQGIDLKVFILTT
jgi:hypothetical protein